MDDFSAIFVSIRDQIGPTQIASAAFIMCRKDGTEVASQVRLNRAFRGLNHGSNTDMKSQQ